MKKIVKRLLLFTSAATIATSSIAYKLFIYTLATSIL